MEKSWVPNMNKLRAKFKSEKIKAKALPADVLKHVKKAKAVVRELDAVKKKFPKAYAAGVGYRGRTTTDEAAEFLKALLPVVAKASGPAVAIASIEQPSWLNRSHPEAGIDELIRDAWVLFDNKIRWAIHSSRSVESDKAGGFMWLADAITAALQRLDDRAPSKEVSPTYWNIAGGLEVLYTEWKTALSDATEWLQLVWGWLVQRASKADDDTQEVAKVGPWRLIIYRAKGEVTNVSKVDAGFFEGIARLAYRHIKNNLRISDNYLKGPVILRRATFEGEKAGGRYNHSTDELWLIHDKRFIRQAESGRGGSVVHTLIHELGHRVYYRLGNNGIAYWNAFIKSLGQSFDKAREMSEYAIDGGVRSLSSDEQRIASTFYWWYQDQISTNPDDFREWMSTKNYTDLLPSHYANTTPVEAWPEVFADIAYNRKELRERRASDLVRTVMNGALGGMRESREDRAERVNEADQRRDSELRGEARRIWKKITTWVRRKGSFAFADGEMVTKGIFKGGYLMPFELITKESAPTDLDLWFLFAVDKDYSAGGFSFGGGLGTTTVGGHKVASMVLPVLAGPFDMKSIETRLDTLRSTFIHEYIHVLDKARLKGTTVGSVAALVDGHASYFQTPSEFNAYFQQGAAELEHVLDELQRKGGFEDLIDKYVPVKASDFVSRALSPSQTYWEHGFLDAMKAGSGDRKWRRKFITRLTVLHKHLREKISSAALSTEATDVDYALQRIADRLDISEATCG